MNGADGLSYGIVQQHRAAVGGKNSQRQTGFIGDERVHIRVVSGAKQALSSICGGDAADIGGVGLLAQYRPALI